MANDTYYNYIRNPENSCQLQMFFNFALMLSQKWTHNFILWLKATLKHYFV